MLFIFCFYFDPFKINFFFIFHFISIVGSWNLFVRQFVKSAHLVTASKLLRCHDSATDCSKFLHRNVLVRINMSFWWKKHILTVTYFSYNTKTISRCKWDEESVDGVNDDSYSLSTKMYSYFFPYQDSTFPSWNYNR